MAFIAPQTTPSPCDINTEFQIFDHDSFQVILSDSLQKAFYIAEQKLKDTIGLKAAP